MSGATTTTEPSRGREEAGSTRGGTKGENLFTAAGRLAHNKDPLPAGFERNVALPSGKRMDGYSADTKEVIEIKPDNARAVRRGEKQVQGYCEECDEVYGPSHKGTVQTYDQAKYLEELRKLLDEVSRQ